MAGNADERPEVGQEVPLSVGGVGGPVIGSARVVDAGERGVVVEMRLTDQIEPEPWVREMPTMSFAFRPIVPLEED